MDITEADQHDVERSHEDAQEPDRLDQFEPAISQSSPKSRPHVTEAVYRLKQREITLPTRKHVAFEDENENADAATDDVSPKKVRRSIETEQPLQGTGGTYDPSSVNTSPKHQRTGSIQDESADDTVLRLSNEFDPIIEPDWDTVIYIGPPPQEHGQDDHDYEYIRQHFSKPYLMSSQTLKDSGSAQFKKFLGPMSARSERKLKKIGVHQMLPQDRKPKYYIDLRPMQDEDEALLMITELTCTPGILSWHMSHLASGVPKTLINGRDSLNVTSRPHARPWIEVEEDVTHDDEDETPESPKIKRDRSNSIILDLEPEYSAVRHYMSIERLLHSLVGHDPKLNSAAKVWTYFSIAKFFDCTLNNKVTNWIYNWLFTSNNVNFVQANPESAYRMAMGMRSPDILRASFAMLVGERALVQAGRTVSNSVLRNPFSSQVSVHGRPTCHLDDDEINRIDHAAMSLTRRMTALFHSLVYGPMKPTSWRTELAKFELLHQMYPDKSVLDIPFELLREYVKGELFQALSQNVEDGDWLRLYRTKGFREFGWLKRSKAFAEAYNAMPLPQRLLTQSFWSQLENYGLYQETDKLMAWSRGHSLDGIKELAPEFDGEIACVSKHLLCSAIEGMNAQIAEDKSWLRTFRGKWYNLTSDDIDRDDYQVYGGFSTDDMEAMPHPDQELVRALQSVGRPEEVQMPGYTRTPFESGLYNPGYPYSAVAKHHRYKTSPPGIKPAVLLAEMTTDMRTKIMGEVLTPGYARDEMGIESEIAISHMDILLCLNDDEWKYLPLWAGGLDDGSGGVFAELDVPDMLPVEGFRGGKMGLGNMLGGDGSVGGSFSMAGDSEDYDEVMTDEGVSTVGKASRIATDGTTSAGASTVMSLDE